MECDAGTSAASDDRVVCEGEEFGNVNGLPCNTRIPRVVFVAYLQAEQIGNMLTSLFESVTNGPVAIIGMSPLVAGSFPCHQHSRPVTRKSAARKQRVGHAGWGCEIIGLCRRDKSALERRQ
jgi:hypothetical protein